MKAGAVRGANPRIRWRRGAEGETGGAFAGSANLRGVDSHGLQLLPFYVEQMEHGNINVAARRARRFGSRRLPGLRR